MSRINRNYLYAIIIALVVSSVSTFIHHPRTGVLINIFGLKYSDIVHGVFNTRFSPYLRESDVNNKWYDPGKYYCLTTKSRVIVYPYIDYKLEYPPLIGLIWFISTNLAIYTVLPEKYDYMVYINSFNEIQSIHYLIQAFINSLSMVLTVYITIDLINRLKKDYCIQRYLLFLLPSMLIYLVYNWDIICTLFLMLGLKNFIDRKWFKTGLFLGLSISTKIMVVFITLAVLIYLFIYMEKFCLKNVALYLTGLTIAVFIPFTVMYIASPRGFLDFVEHHAKWYCENCIYQIVFSDIFSPNHRILAFIFIMLFVSISLYLFHEKILDDIFETSFILLVVTIALNYVFTPQMILIITPLALIVLEKRKLILYSIADSLNALIIILFFEDFKIREFLNKIGFPIPIEFNPWSISSIVQWIAVIRIMILLIIILSILRSRVKNTRLVIGF